MKPVAIFYHCLFHMEQPPKYLPAAAQIIADQMRRLKDSGLEAACSEMIVGVNGGEESKPFASVLLSHKARPVFHGLQCRNECRTIRLLEDWLPGHADWFVLYFHSKGATKPPGDDFTGRWRGCMMKHCIDNWRQCVAALDEGYDVAGVHYMQPPATPAGQYIMAGGFWWSKVSYLKMLTPIMERDRIKLSGIDALESRYEAEVKIGNGPTPPRVKDFHPNWNPSKIATCTP